MAERPPVPGLMIRPRLVDSESISTSSMELRFVAHLPTHRLAKSGVVMQLNHSACPLLRRIDDAGIKRARINVQTSRALAELPRVQHAMDRIARINRAGARGIHFYAVGYSELTSALVEILRL